jgi:hypothetical protein
MRAAHAVSKVSSTRDAVKDVVGACSRELGGTGEVVAALVFYGIAYDAAEVADELARALPGVALVGCSTDGEITSGGLSVDSLCLMLVASKTVRARATCHTPLSGDSFEAGARVARELAAPDARALILLPDGLTGNGSAVIRGAQEVLGRAFIIAGGTAGDRGKFVKTTQLAGIESGSDLLPALMLYSERPLEMGFGVLSGWRPMGVSKVVTEAKGNVVFKIEGETALDVYSTFLGDKASQLPAIGVEYPFALVDESGVVGERGLAAGEEYLLLRAPMQVDRTTGAISFAGEIPEGSKIKMTRARSEAVIDASREAAQRAVKQLSGRPDMVFFFSCMARKIVLGRKTNHEIEAAQEVFGKSVPMIGFYTYGEIANCGEVGPMCRFHNETATFLAIRETT